MNDAMATVLDVVTANTPELDRETRNTIIEETWSTAVDEVVEELPCTASRRGLISRRRYVTIH